jgi:hypothetical protein
MFNGDPMNLHLSNTQVQPNPANGGAGFTCTGGNVIHMTAASQALTGGFVQGDIGLAVTIRRTTLNVVVAPSPVARIIAPVLAGSATLDVAGSCPALVAVGPTTFQSAQVGVAGAGAPNNAAPMMTLGAELNLNPVLVATQDACTAHTLEGFMVVGGWENPGSAYAANGNTPTASVAEIAFPTSVLSFDGWVVPHASGEGPTFSYTDANPHFTFSFPSLPSSVAECVSLGVPIDPTGLEFTVNPTTESVAPFLPTGSGNVGDPPVRSLMPETGPFTIDAQQINNTGPAEVSNDSSTCTVVSLTDPPLLGNGGGC